MPDIRGAQEVILYRYIEQNIEQLVPTERMADANLLLRLAQKRSSKSLVLYLFIALAFVFLALITLAAGKGSEIVLPILMFAAAGLLVVLGRQKHRQADREYAKLPQSDPSRWEPVRDLLRRAVLDGYIERTEHLGLCPPGTSRYRYDVPSQKQVLEAEGLA